MLDSPAAMTRFLRLIASEPDISAVPVMLDSQPLGRDRGRAQVPPGPRRRELDQPQGGRGGLPRARPARPPLRRGRSGHGLRRGRPGRECGASVRGLPARLPAPDRAGRLRPRGHHPRPEHLRHRDRHRGARPVRRRVLRGDPSDQGRPARRARLRRRLERLVQLPRQRPDPRGDPRRLPVSRHRRPGSTWRSSTPAPCRSTTTSTRSCASGSRIWSSTVGPTRPSGSSKSPTGSGRSGPSAAEAGGDTLAWRSWPVAQRLTHALVEGIDAWIVEDTEEARLAAARPIEVDRGSADGRDERRR